MKIYMFEVPDEWDLQKCIIEVKNGKMVISHPYKNGIYEFGDVFEKYKCDIVPFVSDNNQPMESAINEKQHVFAVNKKCYECMYKKEERACLTDYCERGNDDVMFNDEDVENPCKQFERKEYDIETIPRNCKNCFYADLQGDGSAFCDEKETYVSQGGYCPKWKSFRCGDSE